jgi:hypothetical protein
VLLFSVVPFPDGLVTFTPTYMNILYHLNYLNYLLRLHIDWVLALPVYSLVIVFIVLLFTSALFGNGLVNKHCTVNVCTGYIRDK